MATTSFSNPADPASAESFDVTIKRVDEDRGLIEGSDLGALYDRLVQWGASGGSAATFEISTDGEIYKSCRLTQVALPGSLEFAFIAAPQE